MMLKICKFQFVMTVILALVALSQGYREIIDLGSLPNYPASVPASINNTGQVVGYADMRNGINFRACLFDTSGAGNNIHLGGLGGFRSIASAVNDNGMVVGMSTHNDIIPNDRKYGYSLSDKIIVRDGDVRQLSANVPQNVRQSPGDVRQSKQNNDDWNDRQRWILQELGKGTPLQNKHVRGKFKICDKTAQRDLTALRMRGLVDFTGSSRTGVWRLR